MFPFSSQTVFPQIAPAGDHALLVTLGAEVSPVLAERVRTLRSALSSVSGVEACVPAYASLLVLYEPSLISRSALTRRIRHALRQSVDHATASASVFYIPVCYDACFGEDLSFVAQHAGLSEEEVIALHSGTDYLIYMMGFLPGFAYLGGLAPALHTPRLDVPRALIPAGSVGIGGSQTGLYPLDSPGGWRIIGRSPIKPYDPSRPDPFLYQAGHYLHFFPVDRHEYDLIARDVAAGSYHVEIQPMPVGKGGLPQ
ncbi:MAG: 5-oxoprolinase subunit PxpB [Firmicutes bacterium]|nr:5-oxoprolinase subunit PxpB [Bacillota bacterium]